ncbi:MAG: CcmD family protein [Chitinophagaceae bacterium]
MKKILTLFIFACFVISTYARQKVVTQTASESFMRSSGRIYVVVAVMLTILLGLFYYLLRVEQRLIRVEKEFHNN